MSKLRLRISMSLDGYVAGPDQSVKNPLGVGGEQLHEWVIPLAAWRSAHGLPGGDVNESTKVVEESVVNIGTTIMGRNMFGGHPGPWDSKNPWKGWWGENPPFHHPVFVLTHHARAPLPLEGGTTFAFVTDGIEAALERARSATGGKDVSLAGGARARSSIWRLDSWTRWRSVSFPCSSVVASAYSRVLMNSMACASCEPLPRPA